MVQTPRAGTEESRERKIALFWTLVRAFETGQPITQQEIISSLRIDDVTSHKRIPPRKLAYDGNENAHRQKFERDKAAIRDLGFEISTTKTPDGLDAYSIDPTSVFAPPLGLTDDERAVVEWAVALLGIGATGVARLFVDGPATAAGVEFSPILQPLTRAIALQRVVRFKYRKDNDKVRVRELAALGITMWRGVPYVVGVELDTETLKGFRVSRIASTPTVTKDVFDVTPTLRDQARSWEPRLGAKDEDIEIRLTTSSGFARVLASDLDVEISELDEPDAVEVSWKSSDLASARRAVLACGANVRRVRPKELRDDLVSWLAKVNRPIDHEVPAHAFDHGATRPDVLGQTLQLIAAVYEAPTAVRASALAARTGMDLELVRSVMSRIMALQYVRDTTSYLVHIEPGDDVDDEPVDPLYVRAASYDDHADHLSALTWRDTFELVVALKEASKLYPGSTLERIVDKVESVLNGAVRVVDVEPEYLSKVRDAIDNREQIKIDYWSAGRDEITTRWVEPRAMASRNGRWYFRAFCATRQEWLTFRVDRVFHIHAASPVGSTLPPDPIDNWADQQSDEGHDVVISLEPELRWLFEPLPTATWAPFDGRRELVKLRVRDEKFLDQLMVNAGPGASVVSGDFMTAGRALARRMTDLL